MASMLELVDGTTGVEILGTSIGTVHNGVATVELVGIVQILQTLFGHFITRIGNPTVGLLEDGRTQVLVGMPPVGRTGGGAAGTENALVQAIEEKTVFVGLEILHFVVGVHDSLLLQPGLDGGVLFVEVGHICILKKLYNLENTSNEILDDEHVGKRTNGHGVTTGRNLGQAGQAVFAVNVHSTGTANTFTARSTP